MYILRIDNLQWRGKEGLNLKAYIWKFLRKKEEIRKITTSEFKVKLRGGKFQDAYK